MKRRKLSFKRRAMTLMELMVVIVIIGLVSSVVAYNVRGSLEKGRDFKTRQAMNMLEEVIALEVPSNEIARFLEAPEKVLRDTGLVKNPKKLLEDGWGTPFKMALSRDGKELVIRSVHLKKQSDAVKVPLLSGGGYNES